MQHTTPWQAWVREAKGEWSVHKELTVAGLRGIPVPEDETADWYRVCDELTDRDMAPEGILPGNA